jgi:5-methylcytosine-specific restriction endonuclease McrA
MWQKESDSMPIKPENRTKYPADWKKIRTRILERAGHQCEQCRAVNHQVVIRHTDCYLDADGYVWDAVTGEARGMSRDSEFPGQRLTRIVLTIAHLDGALVDHSDANLRALCQRCHLALDRAQHVASARETRAARRAVGRLPGI